jgi:hypothetical protein
MVLNHDGDDVMEKTGTTLAKPLRKHLLSAQTIARSAAASRSDLTRHHGQGNGLRIHLVYFVAVSLVALVALIAAIAVVPR